MGSRLMLVEGNIQRSEDGVVHLVAQRIHDRSEEIERLSEDEFRPQQHADDILYPRVDSRARASHGHPRNVRVLPKSRDFH
jgi:error-prone DNA polymerase